MNVWNLGLRGAHRDVPSVHELQEAPANAAVALLGVIARVARNALIAEHGELSFRHPHVDTDVPPPTLLAEVLLGSLDAVECAATRYLALRNDTEVF